jgi:5'-nucleotidase (lipoprotein e(P4) family)
MKVLICTIFLSMILNDKLPNDVRWVRESDEYKALCNQVYGQAIYMIKKKMTYNKFSLNQSNINNYAVIMDLDETVLDNSDYQVGLFERNESFNMNSWAKWVEREEAKLVPGAKEYIELLRKNNIQIIFISNRMHARLDATKNNMKKLGVGLPSDIYLLRKDRADKKYIRRNEVFTKTGRMEEFKKYTVLQYLGDAMGDFVNDEFDRFGIDQFIFPNPMYGKW